MLPEVLPLRAMILQCLLLMVAVAVEASVFFRMLRTPNNQPISPKQSVQYALSMNLLSTVLGWFTIFTFFELTAILPAQLTGGVETALLNFLFFNRYTNQSLSILILLGFLTFFASFIVKQVGLWALRWLLQSEFPQIAEETEPEREKSQTIRDLRKDPRREGQLNIAAVLFANAWSYSAILLILLLLTQLSRGGRG
ncbi:MAG: hypothetical protein MUF72_09505 [Elainella sp. Prado103]|jgi:hypothetical protein|nr:hypothetical protein [Elainella sp. Prado103]